MERTERRDALGRGPLCCGGTAIARAHTVSYVNQNIISHEDMKTLQGIVMIVNKHILTRAWERFVSSYGYECADLISTLMVKEAALTLSTVCSEVKLAVIYGI